MTSALGAALLTSLLSVVCGVGAVTTAWFLCELFALQIGLGTGMPPRRTGAWLWAGLIQVLAVLVMSSVAGITLLSIGPDVLLGGMRSTTGLLEQLGLTSALLAVAGGLSLALTVPFEHAPALLLDRGGSLSAALFESARLVSASGFVRTWLTSGTAHGLQVAPVALGLTLASTRGSLEYLPWLALGFLPLCAICLALGQGMVVASYLALRAPDAQTEARPSEPPPRAFTAAWLILLAVTLVGPLCVTAALLRPSQPAGTALSPNAQVVATLVPGAQPVQQYLPDSALSIRATANAARIVASDGGGAGKIPLPPGTIARVRVARSARTGGSDTTGAHAIEVTLASGQHFTTFVDDAGVRLDDSAARRLAALLSPWALFALALCLGWTAAWTAHALPRPRALALLVLAPSSLLSGWIGLRALFG